MSDALLVRMPADLHDAVKRRAEVEDRSMASLTRRALSEYLARVPVPVEGEDQ